MGKKKALWQEESSSDKNRQAFRENVACGWDFDGPCFRWLGISVAIHLTAI